MGEKHASACVACKMLAYGNCMCAREVCLLGSCDCGFEKCARAFCFFLCVYLLFKLNNFRNSNELLLRVKYLLNRNSGKVGESVTEVALK